MSDKNSDCESDLSTELLKEEYIVERIDKKRFNENGEIFYFLKWKDYPETANTWEPIDNLDCDNLIKKFEEQCKNNPSLIEDLRDKESSCISKSKSTRTNNRKRRRSLRILNEKNKEVQLKKLKDDDENLVADCILGATDIQGDLMFLVKWKDQNKARLISYETVKENYPKILISYLEKKIESQIDMN